MAGDVEPLIDCDPVVSTKVTRPWRAVNTTGLSILKMAAGDPDVRPAIHLILQGSNSRRWRAGALAARLETEFLLGATGAKSLAVGYVVLRRNCDQL